jgi:hypothetical protein
LRPTLPTPWFDIDTMSGRERWRAPVLAQHAQPSGRRMQRGQRDLDHGARARCHVAFGPGEMHVGIRALRVQSDTIAAIRREVRDDGAAVAVQPQVRIVQHARTAPMVGAQQREGVAQRGREGDPVEVGEQRALRTRRPLACMAGDTEPRADAGGIRRQAERTAGRRRSLPVACLRLQQPDAVRGAGRSHRPLRAELHRVLRIRGARLQVQRMRGRAGAQRHGQREHAVSRVRVRLLRMFEGRVHAQAPLCVGTPPSDLQAVLRLPRHVPPCDPSERERTGGLRVLAQRDVHARAFARSPLGLRRRKHGLVQRVIARAADAPGGDVDRCARRRQEAGVGDACAGPGGDPRLPGKMRARHVERQRAGERRNGHARQRLRIVARELRTGPHGAAVAGAGFPRHFRDGTARRALRGPPSAGRDAEARVAPSQQPGCRGVGDGEGRGFAVFFDHAHLQRFAGPHGADVVQREGARRHRGVAQDRVALPHLHARMGRRDAPHDGGIAHLRRRQHAIVRRQAHAAQAERVEQPTARVEIAGRGLRVERVDVVFQRGGDRGVPDRRTRAPRLRAAVA